MTPEIITRSFSNDQYIFDKVFFENCYKIKGQKDSEKIIVDIGAHAGYFTFLALNLGAKKVYSFEPFIDSFKTLLNNCYTFPFAGRVTPYQLGVYTSRRIGNFSVPPLVDKLYFDIAAVGLTISEEENYYPCFCLALDDILKEYCYGETVDILKINIGYAEREVLLSSNLLASKVKSVCGETSITEEEFLEFKKQMGIKGLANAFSEKTKDEKTLFWFSSVPLSDNYNI